MSCLSLYLYLYDRRTKTKTGVSEMITKWTITMSIDNIVQQPLMLPVTLMPSYTMLYRK